MGSPRAKDEDTLQRRARGREAQRRYRSRKESLFSSTVRRNRDLDVAFKEAIGIFVEFGHHLLSYSSNDPGPRSIVAIQQAYRSALSSMHRVCANLDSETFDRTPESFDENMTLSGVDAERTPNNIQSSDRPTRESSGPQQRWYNYRVLHSQELGYAENYQVPPSVLMMPTQGLHFINYIHSETPPVNQQSLFWIKLFEVALHRSQQALIEGRNEKWRLSPWLSKSHRFSLRHAKLNDLLHLTNAAIWGLANKIQVSNVDRPKNMAIVMDEVNSNAHNDLGKVVKRDLENSGVPLTELLLLQDLELYLEQKGKLLIGEDDLQFSFMTTTQTGATWMHARIAQQSFIDYLLEESLCLGNGIGFLKGAVNKALVSAATELSTVS
ncbi:hypothetical protein PV08_07900 [Exophiala spinifera]|uniref:BZIP domain-containing protein n=1 Tax=Exophiala spinifera TaxID=91928 RepID=A0A0D2B886_9EURO|nr:uncharacterized protein PV08_07900 [Exophiala spinifera]KIW15113.1 hypothetical protein PV08_07900 [Exophiala spinifera]